MGMVIMDTTMDIMVMDTFMERDQQSLAIMDIMAIIMDFMVFIMHTMDTTMVKYQDLSSEWRIYLTLDCRTFQIQSSKNCNIYLNFHHNILCRGL